MASSPLELPILNIANKLQEQEITSIMSPVIIDSSLRTRIKSVFLEEIRLGLAAKPERQSSLLMENTYVNELTNGTEHGSYLALDLGGTNFRVILITFVEGILQEEIVEYYTLPEEVRFGPGEMLFDFIAECISKFMHHKNITNNHYHLGFTFSFPMIQKSIDVGILTSWTKSFNCSGVVGKDVVALLNEALKKKNVVNVTVTAVLNDTTGTLVQGSYLDKRCAIGMILATGNNACYVEKVSNVPKYAGDPGEEELVIDIEWGAFGDNGVLNFLRTEWDDQVDAKSLLKKSFTFEKYIAGKYLGDLVREGLVTLSHKGLFCKGSSFEGLEKHHSLSTSNVAEIERESFKDELSNTKDVLTSLGLTNITADDVRIAQYVCGLFSYRSVLLVSFMCSILLNRMNRPHCTIAIDGSLFENHPRFKPLMYRLIAEYAPDKPFSLLLAKDGSGKGAALVTAVNDRHAANLRLKKSKE